MVKLAVNKKSQKSANCHKKNWMFQVRRYRSALRMLIEYALFQVKIRTRFSFGALVDPEWIVIGTRWSFCGVRIFMDFDDEFLTKLLLYDRRSRFDRMFRRRRLILLQAIRDLFDYGRSLIEKKCNFLPLI